MAYIRIPEEGDSWHAPQEGRAPARRPAEPSRTAGWAVPTGLALGSSLGQPRAGTQQCPRTYLGAGPTAVLDRFDFDVPKPGWLLGSALKPFHRPIVQSLAQQVVASWSTQQPIRLARLVGHTDPVGGEAHNRNLGGRRALEVQNALKAAIEALSPGLNRQIAFSAETKGEECPVPGADNSKNRRVEVFLRPLQTTPPPPPPRPTPTVRIPTTEEAARKIEQERQEREEREKRVRGTPLPPGPPPSPRPRSFGEMFWRWVDGKLDDVLNRFRIPPRLRGKARDLLHEAIQKGSELLLDRGLDALGVTGGAKQAVLGVFRTATQQPSP
jgi:hypothetical protein